MKECKYKVLFLKTRNYLVCILCILTLGILITNLQERLQQEVIFSALYPQLNETAEFRKMQLSEAALEKIQEIIIGNEKEIGKLLLVLMTENKLDLKNWDSKNYTYDIFQDSFSEKILQKPTAVEVLVSSYNAIWQDIKFFPVPESTNVKRKPTSYEDSWMFERNYGGKREHEGTDIMAGDNEAGVYPIISMTAGVVTNIGWLEQGGYRIGITSPSGGYFYYAHLASYEREFVVGETIGAGQLLGYMGDTGYSTVEGTTGMFDVHLHLGIYIETERFEEVSVNPYWVLRYLEGSKLKYDY
jgi:Membrane proteins related to metalloendopeptidases